MRFQFRLAFLAAIAATVLAIGAGTSLVSYALAVVALLVLLGAWFVPMIEERRHRRERRERIRRYC
jgi:Flp pilus assembly protein TadB